MKILFSCRDTNGAHQIVPLWLAAQKRGWTESVIAADPPALCAVRAGGMKASKAGIGDIEPQDASGLQTAKSSAAALLDKIAPEAVVAASSGLGSGIDEALVAVQGAARSFVLQDSWGDINESFGAHAGCYFVLDEAAAELTKKRTNARVAVTGMPKYDAYADADMPAMREQFRRTLGASAGDTIVSFFSQPLEDRPGYADLVASAVEAVAAAEGDVRLVLRSHPKASSAAIAAASAHAAARGVICNVIDDGPVEPLLAASDIVVSAYSTCCYDAIMMGARSPKPLSTALYFMTEPVRRTHHEATGLDALPPVRAGWALLARSEDELRAQIALARQPGHRKEVWKRVRATVPPLGGAAERILDIIALTLRSGQCEPRATSGR